MKGKIADAIVLLIIATIVVWALSLAGCTLLKLDTQPRPQQQQQPQATPTPPTWLTELGAAGGAALMVIGHRYWYHRKLKGLDSGTVK